MAELLKKSRYQQELENHESNRNCVQFTKWFKAYLQTNPSRSGYFTRFGITNGPFGNALSNWHHVNCNEFQEFASNINGNTTNKILIDVTASKVNYIDVDINLEKDVVEYKLSGRYRTTDWDS